MTVEEAEKMGCCLVRINEYEHRMSGICFMMYQTYREFNDVGEIVRFGVMLKDVRGSKLDIEPKYIDAENCVHPEAKYKPFKSRMSIQEIYALGGKAVSYEGRCVRIRRICKEYDGSNVWRYVLVLQDVTAPYEVFDAECYEVSPWVGEVPEPVIKEDAPIVKRYKEMLEAQRKEEEEILSIQERTMENLKEAAKMYA